MLHIYTSRNLTNGYPGKRMEKVTPASNMAMFEYLCYISDVYIYILCMYECRYIYIDTENSNDPCFD